MKLHGTIYQLHFPASPAWTAILRDLEVSDHHRGGRDRVHYVPRGIGFKGRVRVHITIVFLLIAIFSVYTESIHHQRDTLVWRALEARVASAPGQFTPEEVEYLESLRPTAFIIKAGALVVADLLVMAITWMSPPMREE